MPISLHPQAYIAASVPFPFMQATATFVLHRENKACTLQIVHGAQALHTSKGARHTAKGYNIGVG